MPNRNTLFYFALASAFLIHVTSDAAHSESRDGRDGLGRTARIEWSDFDRGRSQTVTIVGEPNRDLRVSVKVQATFGPLETVLVDEIVDVPAARTVEVAIDLTRATNLHSRQASYATRLTGRAAVILPSGLPGPIQRLESRYLIADRDGAVLDVLDVASFNQRHPGGVTDPELRQQIAAEEARYLATRPEGSELEGIAISFEPGLYTTVPRADPNDLSNGEESSDDDPGPGIDLTSNDVATRICIELVPEFEDVSTLDYPSPLEDFWTSNSPKKGRGIRVKVTDKTTDEDVFYDYTGRGSGCTPWLHLIADRKYRVRAYSQAMVSPEATNLIDVRNNPGDDQRFYTTLAHNFEPTAGHVYLSWHNPTPNSVVNIVAAAGYAVNKRYAGLSGKTFLLYESYDEDDEEACGTGSCAKEAGGGVVYLSDWGGKRKFIIAHELGHAVNIKRNEDKRANTGKLEGQHTCTRYDGAHAMTSKEYQTVAAHEGWGHFYAATVWNDPSEPDCAFAYYINYDLDHDGTTEGWESSPWISCTDSWEADDAINIGVVDHVAEGIPGAAYLQVCEDEPPPECSLPQGYFEEEVCFYDASIPYDDQAVEYDWLRALWNLHKEGGATFTDIFRIFDWSDPHQWNSKGDGVFEELESTAFDVLSEDDLFTLWVNLTADHGLRQ